MIKDLTKTELQDRLARFCSAMNDTYPDWDTAVIVSKVNQYYFMGTMQDGMLVIKKDGESYYFVRRSYERAKNESPLSNIYCIESYRDAAETVGKDWGNTFMETENVTLGMIGRLKKYFNIGQISSLDKLVLCVRSVKTPYELKWIEHSGKQHQELLESTIPSLFTEGISEAELVGQIYGKMIDLDYHGVSRFAMYDTELVVGQISFGESSLYPTSFDGPGGAYGMCPAVPIVGSRERKLKKGDLVFVDIGFGVNGYHSDKTQVYVFGGKPTDEMIKVHRACIKIQARLAASLKPGAIPSEIYNSVMNGLNEEFKQNFMGFGGRQVRFLGHGVGLHIDEMPIIANGFDLPLEENMVIALEPKKGIANVGMVGVEDTYIVEPDGGRCITGGGSDIIQV